MPVLPDIPTLTYDTTTADLVARVRDLMAEESADFYDDSTEIIPALNDAILDLFSNVDAVPATFSATTTNGVSHVGLNGHLVGRWETLKLAGSALAPITSIEYAELPDATGIPTSYCPEHLASNGDDVVLLYPTPDDACALTGTYFRIPDLLTTENGATWHKPFHFLVCYYAAGVLLHKDNLADEADRMTARYEYGKQQYRKWLGKRIPYREVIMDGVEKREM